MDNQLRIITTNEHMLHPVGERYPTGLCVVYSKWGISTIGTIQPGFHAGYLPLDEIHAREMDGTAPMGSKLLLRSKYGCWLIGALNATNGSHYIAWAPLPKVQR